MKRDEPEPMAHQHQNTTTPTRPNHRSPFLSCHPPSRNTSISSATTTASQTAHHQVNTTTVSMRMDGDHQNIDNDEPVTSLNTQQPEEIIIITSRAGAPADEEAAAATQTRRGGWEMEPLPEESGRERLKRHRGEVAGRVWIPDIWGKEDLLKDWIDCSAFDSALVPTGLMSARAALVDEGRRVMTTGSVTVENSC